MKNCKFPDAVMKVLGLKSGELPLDFTDTLYEVVKSVPNQEAAEIFMKYYATDATLKELAEEYRVSVNKIHDFCGTAARQILSRKENKLKLEMGLKAYAEYAEQTQELSDKATEKRRKLLKETDTIEELEPSVKVYNCLMRAGIKTIGEVLALTPVGLSKIRNLGRKDYDELVGKLIEHCGEKLENWAYPAKNNVPIPKKPQTKTVIKTVRVVCCEDCFYSKQLDSDGTAYRCKRLDGENEFSKGFFCAYGECACEK